MKRVSILISTLLLCSVVLATATFAPYERTYYGKISPVKKVVATITPTAAADVNSSDRDANEIYGILYRLSISTSGTDTSFGVILKDEIGRKIFEKADCNTVQMPLAYSLYEDDTEGNPHRGILVAGSLYFDVNDVAYTSEQQTIQITSDANDPCSGTFELTFDDVNTAPLAYDINSAELEAALEAISTIDNVTVEGNDLPGDTNVMTVAFVGAYFGGEDIELITIDVSNLASDSNDYTSEQQTIQITSDANDPCSGTFELTFDDVNTTPLAYDINSAEIETALEALSTIDDVSVDGNDFPGDTNIMTVTFAGTLSGVDVDLMTIDVSNLAADTNDAVITGTVTESVAGGDYLATITGTVTESVAGDYSLDTITVTIYYKDEKY